MAKAFALKVYCKSDRKQKWKSLT